VGIYRVAAVSREVPGAKDKGKRSLSEIRDVYQDVQGRRGLSGDRKAVWASGFVPEGRVVDYREVVEPLAHRGRHTRQDASNAVVQLRRQNMRALAVLSRAFPLHPGALARLGTYHRSPKASVQSVPGCIPPAVGSFLRGGHTCLRVVVCRCPSVAVGPPKTLAGCWVAAGAHRQAAYLALLLALDRADDSARVCHISGAPASSIFPEAILPSYPWGRKVAGVQAFEVLDMQNNPRKLNAS
jgi:hypothetical protein